MSEPKGDDKRRRSAPWPYHLQTSTSGLLVNLSPTIAAVHSPGRFPPESETTSLLANGQTMQWDEVGEEASEHAAVWHIYNDEAGKTDMATTDGFNRGIDVLLVFTGLFSAVLTTFIIQSYQQMLPNASDTTNALLLRLIDDLRAASTLNIPQTPVILPITNEDLIPSAHEIRWVNGLWFAALSCSLSAALVSMLAKQWIQMVPNVSGSPRYRARKRQRRYTQLQHWHVFALINALPLLLHVALLLFFAGVIVLLWSGDTAITASTFTTVSLAYIFYIGSMILSLFYPDCPYQHPISEHLRHWIEKKRRSVVPQEYLDLEHGAEEELRPRRVPMASSISNPDDYVDAYALLWLIQQCPSEDIVATALQAIGGLPRDFTAFGVFRDAGIIPMVLQRFSACFQRELSYEVRWEVVHPDIAERYCRAWIRLTHGTSLTWPSDLRLPLQTLKDDITNPHAAAIAACTVALNVLERRAPHLTIIKRLETMIEGEANLSQLTRTWLLETFLECSNSWELHAATVNNIVAHSVPILLRLLEKAPDAPTNHVIASILQTLTIGSKSQQAILTEVQEDFHIIMVPILAAIIDEPQRFGLGDTHVNYCAMQFVQLAAPAFTHSVLQVKGNNVVIRRTLCKLFLEGRIGSEAVPAHLLADVLQILHPLIITGDQQPAFVKRLFHVLRDAKSVNVASGCIRLLEPLLKRYRRETIQVLIEEDGINTLLQTARTGDMDSRRLQIECIRTICVVIQHSTSCYLQETALCPSHTAALSRQFDDIFRSTFFPTLISVIEMHIWWLGEIADVWVPSLLDLCRIKPEEPIWKRVLTVFSVFERHNFNEEGSEKMSMDLETMRSIVDLSGVKTECIS
ncbi:hypothetical protein D9619_011683 [Psilocybe cf. subviscida]|uniref:DUF6535 domain-containing protein n=1 Tax=Psilocybe cf. subviscida TaxID=2480587 RepID=A0A8H5F9M7_9AGAR|nr:hypothetical protein D9619_011683 [Psilocybe cf. subviscida]